MTHVYTYRPVHLYCIVSSGGLGSLGFCLFPLLARIPEAWSIRT